MPARRPARDLARPGETGTSDHRLGRIFAGATVAALCLSLAPIQAAAADTSVDPATYVHSVCTTLGTYKNQLTSLQTSTDLSSATSLTDVRDRLVAFLNQATTATDTAVTDLKNGGTPSIKDGNKIAALIVGEITALRNAFAKAARSAQALSTSNINAFKKQAQAISKSINGAATKAKGVLNDAKKRYNTKVLKAAQSQDPSCQTLSA